MFVETLLPFMVIIAIATYVQTVAGFALGMIVMGAVTIFELVPIAFTSVVISAVTLINSGFILKGNFKQLDIRILRSTVLGMLPGILIGLALLEYLSQSYNQLLQILLGCAIIIAAISMIIKSTSQGPQPSATPAFFAAGTASGILNGLFSMGGPPLVYLFYRQPFDLIQIRMYLLAIFLLSACTRITLVGVQGGLTWEMLLFAITCIPIVLGVSWLGKHYPPPLSMTNMRRFAFSLLLLIGVSLLVQ